MRHVSINLTSQLIRIGRVYNTSYFVLSHCIQIQVIASRIQAIVSRSHARVSRIHVLVSMIQVLVSRTHVLVSRIQVLVSMAHRPFCIQIHILLYQIQIIAFRIQVIGSRIQVPASRIQAIASMIQVIVSLFPTTPCILSDHDGICAAQALPQNTYRRSYCTNVVRTLCDSIVGVIIMSQFGHRNVTTIWRHIGSSHL